MPSGVYRRKTGILGSPPVQLTCKHCGQAFMAKAAYANRRNYCSTKCRGVAMTEASLVTKQCISCGKDFLSQPYRNVKCCSIECSRHGRGKPRRDKNPSGWYIQSKGGYVAKSFGRKTVLQHRHVMEEKLDRPLKPYENVHHINGVKTDNRVENLEIWVSKQPKGQREADIIEWASLFLQAHGFTVSGGT